MTDHNDGRGTDLGGLDLDLEVLTPGSMADVAITAIGRMDGAGLVRLAEAWGARIAELLFVDSWGALKATGAMYARTSAYRISPLENDAAYTALVAIDTSRERMTHLVRELVAARHVLHTNEPARALELDSEIIDALFGDRVLA